MGAPVKIMDLAKQMIRLAGKTLGENIDIEITGLRPGDKLSEELFQDQEPPMATDMAGILLARPRTVDYAIITAKLTALDRACRSRDETAVLALVADLVPELRPSGPVAGRSHLKVVK